ncbi:MAG: fused MFS/spermidine synthase [Candidatus Scalindua rubra]|uniref:Polyamine aminopropyltransferase n=1 Tax=Candidatus Scalindua brodae TaxID=237368 RepID=A0A0B0EGS8_9BACT|nr:MAG: spermidine synthase (putrescine aminopropyltransferase) (SPDSY) [Candidatus Scalindua brodae]MBZ0110217.1 fused MFS/spermidine synthase [Candidatus Scalindua rubra]TWU29021.1 Spermidine synthase [Candidatus Brocadiaceae bacterium S225]
MIRENRAWLFILFSMVFVGCYATIAQVLIIREFLVVFFGSELCIGIILGTWLFGVASGAAVGGRVAGRFKDQLSVFINVLLLMCAILPLELVSIRVLRLILNVSAGQYIPILSLLLSSLCIITPFSFTIGLIFPVGCKVIRGFTRDSAADIGFVYILESIGSLIGGLLFTFVLIARFQPFTIILIFNSILFLNLFLMLRFLDRGLSNEGKSSALFVRRKSLVSLLLFLVTFILLASGVVNRVDNYLINVRWSSSNPNIKLLESINSRYENIVVGVRDDQYSVFGNGQFNFAFPDEYVNSQMAHLIMTQHPDPKRVLLIGGGMGGLIREMLKHPIEELDYIEFDPALTESIKKYLPLEEKEALSDKRVRIFHVDGRYYVKRAKSEKKYDLIFVNIPDPSTAFLNRFYTVQFFQEGNEILANNGVFGIEISSAVNYLGEEVGNYTGSIYQTLHSVFPHVIISPGQTNYYFASNSYDTATFDIRTLTKRYVERGVKSDFFSEHVFNTLLPPEMVKFVSDEIESREGLRVNTDAKPVTYFLNLMLCDKLTGSKLGGILQWIKDSHVKAFLIPVFVFIVCRFAYVTVFRCSPDVQQRFNSIAAIATTGFAGMALEIILIFAFQNIYGYVYENIGFIIAVFMFGMALGGGISNRLILRSTSGRILDKLSLRQHFLDTNTQSRKKAPEEIGWQREMEWIKIFIVLEFIIVVYACIMPFVLNQLSSLFSDSEYLFMILVAITGVLVGLEFPIAGKLYIMRKGELGTTAGTIDSADHAGAFIGALLTGVLFVPLFGISGSCVIIAALNLMSLLFFIHLYYQKKIL